MTVDHQDQLDHKDHRENQVSVELTVSVVSLVMELLDPRVLLDHEEREDKRENQVKPVLTDQKDPVETADVMERMVKMDSPAQEVKRESVEPTVKMVSLDVLPPRVSPEKMVLPDVTDDQDEMDDPVQRESLEKMELLVLMVPVVKREMPETLHPDQKVNKVPQARKERRDHLDRMVSMAQVFLDSTDKRENPEIRSPHPDPKEIKDHGDLQDPLVEMDSRETKETVVATEPLEHVELMVRKDQPDQEVLKENLAARDSEVRLELQELQELLARREIRVLLVPVVLPVLLAMLPDHVV